MATAPAAPPPPISSNTNTNNSVDTREAEIPASTSKERPSDDNAWLNAHYDPLASIYTFSSCITLDDLYGDGDTKLLVGDLGTGSFDAKLKVFKGTQITMETPLLDLPTGLCSFYMDSNVPRTPAVAVASGSYVYVYKNLRPYFKFTIPSLDVNSSELDLWTQVKEDKIDVTMLREHLESLRSEVGSSALTVRTLKFLQLGPDELQNFASRFRNTPLKRLTVITCITSLHKSHSEVDAISCLVIGTEHHDVYILDPEAFTILSKVSVPGTPVFLSVSGLFDVDYRIVVACRNAHIYTIKKGSSRPKYEIVLSSQPSGLQRVGKNVVIATMDKKLICYTAKGKCLWTVDLPDAVTTLELMDHKARGFKAVLLAMRNREVRIYRDKYLVNSMTLDDVVVGIKFGRFGREDGALVLVTQCGSLIIKLLRRTVSLEGRELLAGPPTAQSSKLSVPKKTKVFVEQTQREREYATAMHETFQHDLYRLRLETARAYVKSLAKREIPLTTSLAESIKISAQVHGLGPLFKLTVTIQNNSPNAPLSNLCLVCRHDEKLYTIDKPIQQLPLLVPSLSYNFATMVQCQDTLGRTEPIKVLVHRGGSSLPLLTALIDMPVSESLIIA